MRQDIAVFCFRLCASLAINRENLSPNGLGSHGALSQVFDLIVIATPDCHDLAIS